MAELIYSIEKVFGDYLRKEQWYNIPEYQRGYKWSSQQIKQLLDDINEFDTGGDAALFYCLQNITLVEKNANLNVVDGQQRLTTIALLLAYLEESEKVKGKLHYAVRIPSNDFIQKVLSNEGDIKKSIIDTDSFDDFIRKSNQDYDYQDIYFMYSGFRTINYWFTQNEKEPTLFDKNAFKEKFLYNVKLIVNRITGIAEQELFMNLNTGRVQLDGSDLIRAILITRVAKQEMEEFDSTDVKDVVRLNERRIRIGWELDELNAWWSKENVSDYFSVFTAIKTGEKETIKFEQDKHPINLLYKIWVESKGESEIKLSLFETKREEHATKQGLFETINTKALDLYTSIVLLHRTLKDWFEDREIYHYLGFLFITKSISFNAVWKEWNTDNYTRVKFISFLKDELKKSVFGKEPNGEMEETGLAYWLNKIKDYDSEIRTNWYETGQLEKILITLDIIEHVQYKEKGIPLPFLGSTYFKNHNEDKEHIFPGTPKDIKAISILSNPEESFKIYIDELNRGYTEEKLITWIFSVAEWELLDTEEKNKKLLDLKQEIHKKRPTSSIGNLVLLHQAINRGFGNNYYTDKRISVIKNTESGEYVRQHTLKVFIKQTENNDLNNWTMLDIEHNASAIHDKLKVFFDFKNEGKDNE